MITYLLAVALLWLDFEIIGPAAISQADEGVLEAVAERRIANGWGLDSIEGYDTLVAPADCRLLGREGWLIVGGEVIEVVAVDCEADVHAGQMESRGLLVDTNRKELVHLEGWLVLR